MSGSYPAEIQNFIRQELANGHYQSEDQLVTAALSVYRELNARHENLRQEVLASLAQAERGQCKSLDIESIIARGRERLATHSGELAPSHS